MTKQIPDEDIEKIMRIYENLDMSQTEIAKMWNTSQAHISRIVNKLRRAKKVLEVTT